MRKGGEEELVAASKQFRKDRAGLDVGDLARAFF